MNKVEDDGLMNPDRVSTLIDGIFAIAMTLLILSLEVPHISGQLSDALILSYLYNIVSPFTSFVLSFILLAMFWTINHSQMHYIKRVDKTYLWISIILLLFIVIVPFSTEISGMYGSYTIPQLIFNLNLLGVAILLYLSIYYSDKKMLIEDMNEDKKKTIKRSSAFFIIVALVAVVLSFIAPSWSTIVYMAIILEKLL
jgi:uncharacterized membrane protein